MSRWSAAIIVVLLGAALACLGGCSALRIGYGTAPDAVYWWLDGYVDFSDAQTPRARAAIAQWFAWNRRTQLPDYAAQLARARVEVLADTTPARVCEWQEQVVQRAHLAFEQILPAAADLALTLTPSQVQHVERRYAKFNTEFRSDFLQPDARERAAASFKRTLERAETLYGTLDDAQRERVADAIARSPFDAEVWFAERRARQQLALQLMRTLTSPRADRGQAQAALRMYVEQLEHSPREAYRRYADRLNEFNCAFGASLHNATTPAQRRTAASRLAGWEADLRAIATASERAPGND